jgi:hypothetical protein
MVANDGNLLDRNSPVVQMLAEEMGVGIHGGTFEDFIANHWNKFRCHMSFLKSKHTNYSCSHSLFATGDVLLAHFTA